MADPLFPDPGGNPLPDVAAPSADGRVSTTKARAGPARWSSLTETTGCQAQGQHLGYGPALVVAGIAGIFVAIQFLWLPAVTEVDVSGLVAETLICLIPFGGLFVVQHLRPCPPVYWPMMGGLSVLLLSHLADALDEVRAQPVLVGIFVEDGLAVLGFSFLVLGLVRWVRFNQRTLEEIQALNAGLEQRVAARTATLEREIAERQQAEERLRASEGRYRELNAVLEQRVAERTAEVQAANIELQRLATTDQLTGARNRHYFEEAITAEVNRALRYGDQPLSLVLFDIDYFKAINDTHGHLVGDQVLVELTRRMQDHLRSVDVLARWGGEEFMVLLPHTGGAEAVKLAEKLRRLVVDEPFAAVGQVTSSFGVAEFRPDETLDLWLKRVDDALYAAKAGGRNRVSLAEPT